MRNPKEKTKRNKNLYQVSQQVLNSTIQIPNFLKGEKTRQYKLAKHFNLTIFLDKKFQDSYLAHFRDFDLKLVGTTCTTNVNKAIKAIE